MAGSASSFHIGDKRQQSKCPAWFQLGGDGLAASFAPDGEVAEPGLGEVPHRNSIGEYKTSIIHSQLVKVQGNFIASQTRRFSC